MDNSIYEVCRDDYVGFNSQIKPDCKDTEVSHLNDLTIIKVISKNTGRHLCSRIISDSEEHYYIFNMPENYERQKGQAIKKITLKTQEEVQTFFNVLAEIAKENK